MKTPQNTKIIVGISGGVDSAVTAYLLKKQGYDVAGCYMQNWMAEKDDPYCSAEKDMSDAKKVCEHLDIPFHLVNFSKEYWDNVFQYCLDEFVAGRTPNPDIWCNQFIKFDVFLKHAINLGADFLATGHYVRKSENQLLKAKDLNKDQSYFLYTLNQEKLSRAIFPLGELTKPEVRAIAKEINLPVAEKKDSTGICFIGERKFKNFLQDFILAKPGVMKTPEGKTIGKHDGLMFYTLGQRKGLNIGGVKYIGSEARASVSDANLSKCEKLNNLANDVSVSRETTHLPWYVVAKNIPANELIVAQGHDHPLLFSNELMCEKLHWISWIPRTSPRDDDHVKCTAKIRYRQTDQPCTIYLLENNSAKVIFDEPQRAITPGQSIVFYDGEVCLGGAVIV